MKLLFVNMIMLLSVSMAALSCSKGLPYEPAGKTPYTIVVSGTALDKSEKVPLHGIEITLHAAENGPGGEIIINPTEVRTDSIGRYTLKLDGFLEPISCTITASDPHNIYGTSQQEIRISWSGTSFDEYTGYFYVNDCDFYMEKLLKQ
jgi:hypothetical protein